MIIEKIQKSIKDTRSQSHTKYTLESLVFVIFSAVISGYSTTREISVFAKTKFDWLSQHVDLPSVPSRETLRHVLCIIAPQTLIHCFKECFEDQSEKVKHIAVDGKTMCDTSKKCGDALHILSAWSSTHGLTIGALKSEGKKNEIKTIPKLISLLDCKGATITLDAMGCQKSIAKAIIDSGNDYVLQIKANQKRILDEIKAWHQIQWRQGFKDIQTSAYEDIDKGHGRVEIRHYEVFELGDWIDDLKNWEGLKSAVKVTRTRIIQGTESTEESWYICSLEASEAKEIGKIIRQHWSVENPLHWRLDVVFKDDQCQYSEVPALNMTLIKRHCMNLLTLADLNVTGMKARVMQAALSDEVRSKIITG